MDGALYSTAEPERQPVHVVSLLEWQHVELERELARQRSERRQPVCCSRNPLHFKQPPI